MPYYVFDRYLPGGATPIPTVCKELTNIEIEGQVVIEFYVNDVETHAAIDISHLMRLFPSHQVAFTNEKAIEQSEAIDLKYWETREFLRSYQYAVVTTEGQDPRNAKLQSKRAAQIKFNQRVESWFLRIIGVMVPDFLLIKLTEFCTCKGMPVTRTCTICGGKKGN